MHITATEIEFEHKAALASLTAEQRKALARVQRATQAAHFNHHTQAENLRDIFEAEANALEKARHAA